MTGLAKKTRYVPVGIQAVDLGLSRRGDNEKKKRFETAHSLQIIVALLERYPANTSCPSAHAEATSCAAVDDSPSYSGHT